MLSLQTGYSEGGVGNLPPHSWAQLGPQALLSLPFACHVPTLHDGNITKVHYLHN